MASISKGFRLLIIACLVASYCFLFAGCAPSERGAGSGASSASKTSLTNADVAGNWQVTTGDGQDMTALVDKGAVSIYKFSESGTFTMESHALDASFTREGTYEIKDGKVYVNVPEAKVSTGTAAAIENGEVTIEGNTLKTDAIGKGGIEARKLSDSDYSALVEKVEALGPKKLNVGDYGVTDFYSFTVSSIDFEDEIYPSDTSGYYRYYTDESGKSYLVAEAEYYNGGTEYALPGYGTAAVFSVGDNKYQASIVVDGGANLLQSYRIEAKDSSRVVVFASVPDGVIGTGDVSLTWYFPKDAELMNTYYKSSFDHDTYIINK